VLEVLAEAYVWIIVGRWRELPQRVFSEMQAILNGGELSAVVSP
jgi:hypothetical protein